MSHHRHDHSPTAPHAQQPPEPHSQPHHGAGGHFDLAEAALAELHDAGFHPEFGPGVAEQVAAIERTFSRLQPQSGVDDLRALGWSSIDNDTSRDLDQIEVAERTPKGIRLHVAIGDVAAAVEQDSPIDKHAREQTQTIYTAVRNFPMLPLELSTGLTSLNENVDRQAVTMSFTVTPEGNLQDEQVSRALVRNRAQLAYSRVGPWLEKNTPPSPTNAGAPHLDSSTNAGTPHLNSSTNAGAPHLDSEMWASTDANTPTDISDLRSDSARSDSPKGIEPSASLPADWLAQQLKLQGEAADALHACRIAAGALEFQKAEAEPVVADGRVKDIHEVVQNRAMHLIEDLMVAANGVMARALRKAGRSALQRIVRVPQRWDRIVSLAALHNGNLPANPDSVALNNFLTEQRRLDRDHYPDLAVAVIKLMGPGEYTLMRADEDPTGHFGLAARDYTHSTAPNRRFPDLVTQRILHALVANQPAPYTDADLTAIALHCNEADKALRKIERAMAKRVAAVALIPRIGQVFRAVVTGASNKGVYARVISPPFEGRIVQNDGGLDVGDRIQVKLLHTDPARAFIDLAKV